MLRDLQLLHSVGTVAGLSDRALIESFRSGSREGEHAQAEAALGALVERHAAMVWSVCRAVAGGAQDAEDAFQATFLILVRKAGSVLVDETLGPWLHVVAYRTALAMRTSTARRRQAEERAAARRGEAATADDPASTPNRPEIPHAAVHAEILRLPERFRTVVVLCDLEGLSYHEAARRLDVPLGTVQSRLARARARLRRALDPQRIRADNSAILLLTSSLPASLARRTSRLGALISADPASIPAELTAPIRDGIRSCFGIGRRQALAASLGGAALVGGCLLYAGSVPQEPAPPAVQQPPARPTKVDRPTGIPAPQKLKVSSGKGKTVLYTLDAEGKRIPVLADEPKGPWRTVEQELHWAVVTGILDHEGIKKALVQAGLEPSRPARELYARMELERQVREEDGGWSASEEVDMMPTLDILDRLASEAVGRVDAKHRVVPLERIDAKFRLENLVDPLPWLTSGRFEGVDVDKTLLLQAKPEPTQAPAGRNSPAPEDGVSSLMFRTFDFSASTGQTYRYRARVVLWNPAFPRTKRGNRSLFSPWSEPTAAVTIP
ncbi:MAG: RNA polymerase sigma factor [Isosphaeraceae bacterium]